MAPLSDDEVGKLLDRCHSGEIRTKSQLDAEIAKFKPHLPQPAPVVEQTRESRLAAAKQALEDKNQVFMKDSINEIRRHGGNELADAILLHEVQVSVEQIYQLARRRAELAALAPQILAANRFPLGPVSFQRTTEPIGLPTDKGGSNQKADYQRIWDCGSEHVRQAMNEDGSRWFQNPEDCRLCAKVTINSLVNRIAELCIFEHVALADAYRLVEEDYVKGFRFRNRLRDLGIKVLNEKWKPKIGIETDQDKHVLADMITAAPLEDLFSLVKLPGSSVQ
jgi:hypothetical protein